MDTPHHLVFFGGRAFRAQAGGEGAQSLGRQRFDIGALVREDQRFPVDLQHVRDQIGRRAADKGTLRPVANQQAFGLQHTEGFADRAARHVEIERQLVDIRDATADRPSFRGDPVPEQGCQLQIDSNAAPAEIDRWFGRGHGDFGWLRDVAKLEFIIWMLRPKLVARWA